MTVSDEEVDAAYSQAQELSSKQPQYLISEIFLAVDAPSAEEQVKQNITSILGQLKEGANFSALARQFSQSATASSGGDMGRTTLGDLPEPVGNKVKAMATGALSEPSCAGRVLPDRAAPKAPCCRVCGVVRSAAAPRPGPARAEDEARGDIGAHFGAAGTGIIKAKEEQNSQCRH